MADIGKSGYNWTGYTEPFILTEPIAQGEPLAKVGGWGSITIDGGVPIEKTEFKNSTLFVNVHSITSPTEFISKNITFDSRKDPAYNPLGRFIITDGVDQAIVSGVVYNDVADEYTITTSAPLSLVAGRGYKVIGRVVDVGDVVASQDLEVGDVIFETFPVQGGSGEVPEGYQVYLTSDGDTYITSNGNRYLVLE